MAVGLPTPKSREQLFSEMVQEYVGLTGIDDLNTGSAMTQFFDVVARAIARTSGDIFQILRDFSLDRATGEALVRIGEEERVYKTTSRPASGVVKVIDTSFQKIQTKVYSGASSPNIGSTVIKVSDAPDFPASGTLYIGRGTPNIEGPINYSAVTQIGSYWEITLDSPTTKFHNISESVILGQGGTRNVPVGSIVTSPSVGATADINYSVASAAILLDGENVNSNVQITAQEPGSFGNAPIGGITEFATEPFPGASVINETPLTNGADEEADDDYRDRIKKARLSRGLGTSLAVRNAVQGAQAPDEDAIVTSSEIDTTNPEETILYIDSGGLYEEKTSGIGLESLVDSAIGGEQNFQMATGGSQTSIARAFLQSTLSSPFDVSSFDRLAMLVGGVISEHVFGEDDFQAQGSATAYEIVASINNNPDNTFEAYTAENGTEVVVRSKNEDNEFLELTTPSTGVDAGPKLGFPTNEVATVLLYKNKELLNKNGRSAFVISKQKSDWSSTITDGDTLIVSVDGTASITYTFEDEDFIAEGQHTSVSNQNSLSSWVNVINTKVTGVTAEVNGEQIKLTSNLDSSNRASISIDLASTLVSKGIFSSDLGLSAEGNEADFEISRNTAQIKLNTPLSPGDRLTLGSEFTKAEISSSVILGGSTTLTDTGYVWVVIDDKNASPVLIGVTAETFVTISKPGSGVVRYESDSPSAFDNVEVGDYVIIWSDDVSPTNRLEGRINAKTSTTIDLKVTAAEEAAAVAEGPLFYNEGITVIRTDYTPQKIKVDAGTYTVTQIAGIIGSQITNGTVAVDNDETIILRTNTEDIDGAIFIADFNEAAKNLNFTKSASNISTASQLAFYETTFKDRQFPSFVHSKINVDQFADPIDSYINTVGSVEDLAALGLDPSGFICFSQPYGAPEDVQSKECVEIEDYLGTTINVEDSPYYKRSRVDDRYHVLNPYDFGHNDSVVVILDNDPTGKTFSIPVYRTAVTNITLPNDTNNFRADDLEGGTVDFTEFFGSAFDFQNYKALMQAKNVIDPSAGINEDAILYRSVEWGVSGEKFGVGYFYPTSPDQEISHIVRVDELVDINIYLKSGPVRITTIDGTTEWNVSTAPLSGSVDLVTYTYSGTGTTPGLGAVNSGDYVSIISTGDFSEENEGAYRVNSATATSFTVLRATNAAVVETDVATLETNTISFFESSDTTAQEIVDYATDNISDYITAEIIEDVTTAGAGIIDKATSEDSDFAYDYVRFLDGKNYILSSDISAVGVTPQFVFKNALNLPSFDTNTVEAYSFNDGEQIRLVPLTSLQLNDLWNVLAVTGFTTLGSIKSVDRNTNIQLATDILGSGGSVQVAGGSGNTSVAVVDGSANTIGTQDNQKTKVTISEAASNGFHSDQWVKVEASEIQKKIIGVTDLNSIKVDFSVPVAGFSKIELFNRSIIQRLFGRNRYHTRTRGRAFRIEKQGQFACISWDENGTEPFFAKSSVDVKDASASTVTINKIFPGSLVDISVDSGDMRFDEVYKGDLVTISNRLNSDNDGVFKVLGVSKDAKTIRIQNANAINELASGSFTITDNVVVLGDTFTIGGTTLTEGVDFLAGVDETETASNLSAAIANISNISSSSLGTTANVVSDIPGVSVAISTSGGGATASGASLEAPISNTGDLSFESEVSEGDSVTISSDFTELNKGTFTVIRRFKNSIYIDNSNVIEEEVTLADQFLATGADGATDYDIDKTDGLNRLKWAGTGAEPSLEDARPGDTIVMGTDFNASNQGEFHVVDSGTKLQEISSFKQARAVDMTTGQYGLLFAAEDVTEYYFWYNKAGGGGDPAIGGKTGIEIPVGASDSAEDVAIAKANVINTTYSADFTATVDGDVVTVTTTGYGETTNSSNVDVGGDFAVDTEQEGRRNFVEYINVNGVSEAGITIGDVLEIHREAIKFKEYEGTVPGDVFVVSNSFLGSNNVGNFVVSDVLSESEIIVTGNMESVPQTLLDTNSNKIYINESKQYVGYKQIELIATAPSNLNSKNVIFNTSSQFEKIGEIGGVSLNAVSKLDFPTGNISGLDSYKYHTGLIAEANRIVYGEPRDNTTYPGVAAAGAEIFIKGPLPRRIQASIDVRVNTGVPFSIIIEEVRNSVAALIQSNPVGNPIAISAIISVVDAIVGIKAVAISSPQYDAQNDVIKINSGEKALILDVVSDIIVSKID